MAAARAAGVTVLDVLDPQTAVFQRLLGAANAHAFGSLGMPPWVQFDCATLPTVFTGFALDAGDLQREAPGRTYLQALVAKDAALRPGQAPAIDADSHRSGLVPLSGFSAARTEDPATVVAFSLLATGPVPRLGARTKALGLGLLGAHRQVGVTQYDNAAVRVHARFGALEILAPRAAGHSRPDSTFVYALDGLDPVRLLRWGIEGAPPPPRYSEATLEAATEIRLPINEEIQTAVARRMEEGARLAILPPGTTGRAGGRMLRLGRVPERPPTDPAP